MSFLRSIIIILNIVLLSCLNLFSQDQKTIDSLKMVINTAKHDTMKIKAYNAYGDYYIEINQDTAVNYYKRSIDLTEKFLSSNPRNDVAEIYIFNLATNLGNLGYISQAKGNINDAINFNLKALNNYTSLSKSVDKALIKESKQGMAQVTANLGYIYNHQGNVHKALEFYGKSLKCFEEIKDLTGTSYLLNNIAHIYKSQGDIDKALQYFLKCINTYESIIKSSNKKQILFANQGMATTLSNIGNIYQLREDYTTALDFHFKSLKISEKINYQDGIANTESHIGGIYEDQAYKKLSEHDKVAWDTLLNNSLYHYNKSLIESKNIGNKIKISYALSNIAGILIIKNKPLEALTYAKESYHISKEINYPANIQRSASILKKIYEFTGNYKKAFDYYKEEILMRDSIANDENYKETMKQQANYEYEKKAATDSLAHSKAIEIKNLELSKQKVENRKQQIIIFSSIGGFLIVLVFSIIILRMFRQKRNANIVLSQQKEEISAQRDEITAQRDTVVKQKDHIEEQKKEITDSINYAKRIQQAVLPSDDFAYNLLGEHFILFRPKDIVSGDFYFFEKRRNNLLLAVADCTGHGVPGGFMSMLGISFLQEVITKEDILTAGSVLDQLRDYIIHSLQQRGVSGEQKDGMDLVFCAINTDTLKLQYAGANNPLFIFHNQTKELTEISPDKMPVAIHENMNPYTNHEIQLQQGDIIYLMSDGYEDQFGGPKGKKFLSKNIKQTIKDNAEKSLSEQKIILESTLDNWMNNGGTTYDQTDDITVIGMRI